MLSRKLIAVYYILCSSLFNDCLRFDLVKGNKKYRLLFMMLYILCIQEANSTTIYFRHVNANKL